MIMPHPTTAQGTEIGYFENEINCVEFQFQMINNNVTNNICFPLMVIGPEVGQEFCESGPTFMQVLFVNEGETTYSKG